MDSSSLQGWMMDESTKQMKVYNVRKKGGEGRKG